MNNYQSRLRMFAGPNGSGKSTIKSFINSELLGVYINPDDIQYQIQNEGFVDFSIYKITTAEEEISLFITQSSLAEKAALTKLSKQLRLNENKLYIQKQSINSYIASVLSDFIRHKLLANKASLSFETVMSSPDKIEFLKKAQDSGFRTYLYYVATDDPLINISRVRYRIKTGGHSVPEDKIVTRYHRSINLLSDALQYTHRAYIFDNSGHRPILLAEVTNGAKLELKTKIIPNWFKNTLNEKFDLEASLTLKEN